MSLTFPRIVWMPDWCSKRNAGSAEAPAVMARANSTRSLPGNLTPARSRGAAGAVHFPCDLRPRHGRECRHRALSLFQEQGLMARGPSPASSSGRFGIMSPLPSFLGTQKHFAILSVLPFLFRTFGECGLYTRSVCG
jgi:hypothetical protein